jgi:putative ABC transport system permease protein
VAGTHPHRWVRALAAAVVAAGSLIVPRWRRADWRREWDAELWYEHDAPLSRSAGAIPHAVRLLEQHWSLDMLMQDLRYGARMLRRSPGFTLAAVVTLALGIGAATAVFSIVHSVLWRPLPYADSARLVQLWETNPDRDWVDAECAPANFADWRRRNRSFTDMAAYFGASRHAWIRKVALTGSGDPVRLNGLSVTANFFRVLGVQPAIGRGFLDREEWKGSDTVAVLSDGVWRRQFGGDPSIVGRSISLDGTPHTVVGVLPAGFRFDDAAIDVYVPFGWTPAQVAATRRPHYLRVIARLKPGVSVEQAGADVHAIAAALQKQYPDTNTHMDAGVGPLREWIVGPSRQTLLLFLGAVAFVLLLACANVANLLLARAATRQQEIAVRSALGASRTRLVRQMLTESLLLSGIGAAFGLLIAYAAVRAVVAAAPAAVPRLGDITIDSTALLVTTLIAVATGVVFGVLPARRGSGGDAARVVHGSRAGAAAPSMRARNVLVVAELALSLVLIVGASLLTRSFYELGRVDLGFVPDRAVALPIVLPASGYRDRDAQRAFLDRLLERVRALPGIEAAGAAEHELLSGELWSSDFTIEHRPPDDFGIQVRHNEISPGYLQAIGARIAEGRDFTDADRPPAPTTVLVNETLVRRYFKGQDPVGQRLNFDRPGGTSPWRTIVGVVRDFREASVNGDPPPTIYEPFAQNTDLSVAVVMRTERDAASLAPALRAVVHDLDPSIPVPMPEALDARVAAALAPMRFSTTLMALFAGVGLVLATVGLYGVLSYLASQRTHEIGVRLALGATDRDVARLVAVQAAELVGLGLVLGIAVALAAGRLMQGLLFGVQPTDPLTYTAGFVVLALVAAMATSLPIRRAMRVDPVTALRTDG